MRKQICHVVTASALLVACSPSAAMDPASSTDTSADTSSDTASTSSSTSSPTSSPTSSFTTDGDDTSSTSAASDDSAGSSSGGAICGDGILEGHEQCDDGNTYNVDGCTASCKSAVCGDRIVQFEWEECDQGADNGPGMPCNSACERNVCGDGDPGPGEACDDGNADDTDACMSICELAVCGDGIVHSGVESCDDQGDSATCDGDCTLVQCGDGHVNNVAGEECEDGNNSSLDNCSTSCKAPTLRLFITSEIYTGALGGLVGADAKCQSLAKKAALPGTYKAWLSSESMPGATRLYHSPGRYKRLDGVLVADNFDQLRDGPLHAPVIITDTMQDVHALDMMEPDEQGVYKSHASYWSWEGDQDFPHREGYCHDWTVVQGMGAVSKVEKTVQGASDIQFLFPCDAFMALLCVQQAWYPED